MKRTLLTLVIGAALLTAARVKAVTFSPFGVNGAGGDKNGQSITVGTGGSVFELDAFLTVAGYDLNGGQAGGGAQLSSQSLPPGLTLNFSAGLSNQSDLVLTYIFANQSTEAFTNLNFSVLLDAEIDQAINTFFNEYGRVIGVAGLGPSDPAPDSWQIDEPGFAGGNLFANLFAGSLNNSNSVPVGSLNDVAFGLGLALGDLGPGQSTAVNVMISDAGHYLGTFALQQLDSDANSTTAITLSAIVSTLTGTIFKDLNTNSISDPGEGLAGIRLLLISGQTTAAQTLTDTNGNYSFNNPPPGDYTLKVDPQTVPAGLTNIVDPDGTLDGLTTVSLAPGQLKIANWGYRSASGPQTLTDVTALASLNFAWRLKASTGSLIGKLTITNLPSSTASLGQPFRLGFPTSTNFWYAHPEGNLDNGIPFVDITALVTSQAGLDGLLSPGEAVVVDGIEVYSRNRSAPPTGLFQLWATQQ